jgi:DNA-binding GntR family transcriptional regulator
MKHGTIYDMCAAKGRQAQEEATAILPLPLTSRSGLVAEAIKEAILSGRIAAGEELVERNLARAFGVSTTPVREALIALVSTGIVEPDSYRATRVRVPDSDSVREIYEIRLLLEVWAVGRTAAKYGDSAVQRSLLEAGDALAEARETTELGDRPALARANRRFHRALYANCGNRLVLQVLDNFSDRLVHSIVSLLWERWPTWVDEEHEHRTLLNAVSEGDAKRAEGLLRAHIRGSLARLDSAAGDGH